MAGLANPSRWLTMSGDYTAQRFSPLKQITPANVGQLAAQWTCSFGFDVLACPRCGGRLRWWPSSGRPR